MYFCCFHTTKVSCFFAKKNFVTFDEMDKMPQIIEGFSQIEYLLVFNAIVFGAIAGEYFGGWGAMLRNREYITFSPIQFTWSIFAFLILVQNWFGIWPRSEYINNGVQYFYFSLIPMLLFYLISVVIFPQMRVNTAVNFQEHYRKNSDILFGLFAIYLFVAIIGSAVYYDLDKGDVLKQNLIRAAGIALCGVCIKFKDKMWIHYAFIALSSIGLFAFLFQIPE
jgi:hypothetical protein